MNYRHMTSNIYKISSIFRMPDFRQRWSHFLPSLGSLYIGILIPFMFSNSVNYRVKKNELTRLYKEKNFIYTTTTTVSHTWRGPMTEASKKVNIQGIHFTDQQNEQLQQFSPATIAYANQVWLKSKDIVNPGGFFIGVCRNHDKVRQGGGLFSKKESMFKPTNTPSEDRDVDDLYRRKNTTTGKASFLPSYMKPQQQSQEKTNLNPVEEYYRVELLRETPKYKRSIEILRYHPENPFAPQMRALGLPLTCDPLILEKMRLGEKLAHMSGATQCIFNTMKVGKDGHPRECAFAELYNPSKESSNLTQEEQTYVL